MDGILYVNKPVGWTSFDVVAKIRSVYKTKSVGHTGTLDPQATGVLVILVGKACKAGNFLVADQKEYIATCRLGQKYDTGDIWGQVIEQTIVPEIDEKQVCEVLQSMQGKQMQIPPMYSAIKVKGKKLYEYARNNQKVEVLAREIDILEIELLKYDHEICFRIVCSSGTYIRTVCEELAMRLGTVGAMSSLVRTRVAEIQLEDCFSLEKIIQSAPPCHETLNILSQRYPTVVADSLLANDICNGKKVILKQNEPLVCIAYEGKALAVMEKIGDQVYKSKRGLW